MPLFELEPKHHTRNAYGVYDTSHFITLSKGIADTETTLHEITHAITVHKIRFGLQNPKTEHGRIAKEIQSCFELAKKEAQKRGLKSKYYGLTDILEFVACAYGNHDKFREFLSSIKVAEDGNLFVRFLKRIREILGFTPQESNLFLKTLYHSNELMKQRLEVRGRGKTRRFLEPTREDVTRGFVTPESSGSWAAQAEANRQYDEVVAKYKGTDLWMKAPNGQPTKLTERQWVQVRTPNFKRWWGFDWDSEPETEGLLRALREQDGHKAGAQGKSGTADTGVHRRHATAISSLVSEIRAATSKRDSARGEQLRAVLGKRSGHLTVLDPDTGEPRVFYHGAEHNRIDFGSFVKEDPESYHKLAMALRRESRRVVQENDLASMIPIMGTTLGKTVFQFMNFAMQAWSKSMLFGMNHRDFSTLMTVWYGSILSLLVYTARTHAQASGMKPTEREEFLEKRLSTAQIVANTFGRLQQATILPNLIDTISPVPFFSGMRTTSDATSIASNPSWQLINSVISAKKLLKNAWSDEEQTTQRDARALFRILPLANTLPAMALGNHFISDLPTSEKER